MFRISDDDFQELIKIIDPEHTGHLSYNKFLNLFEDKDAIVSLSVGLHPLRNFCLVPSRRYWGNIGYPKGAILR